MASWFTRAIDTLTPWDRGGEVERRKKREEEQQQARAQSSSRAPTQSTGVGLSVRPLSDQEKMPTQARSEFNIGLAPQNNVQVPKKSEYDQLPEPEKPKQSFWNKVRDQFDANTEADQYRRARGNIEKGEDKPLILKNPGNIVSKTPIVGHVAKAANTMANQFRESRETERGLIASLTNNPEAFRASQERQDKLRENYKKNSGGLFNVGTLYGSDAAAKGDLKTGVTDIVAPTVVTMADLYTLGQGNIISEGIKQGGKAGVRTVAPNIGKATVGNYISGDVGARSEGADSKGAVTSGLINSVLGLAPDIALPALGRSFANRVLPKIMGGRWARGADIADELGDASISAGAETAKQTLAPRRIPVAQNIPVEQADDVLGEAINVRNLNDERKLIQEIGGDAQTPQQAMARVEQAQRDALLERAAADANAARPDPSIDGVTPRKNESFSLDEKVVKESQDKIASDYADMLRDYDKSVRGGDMVPDGEGGFIRTSEHSRFYSDYYAANGKPPTKAAWREYAQQQLASGKAMSEIQREFDDVADPSIQSMLTKGEQEPAPIGKPIRVQEARGIDVKDVTNVPENLPETPGKVRVTAATAPAKAETEMVARQPAVVPIQRNVEQAAPVSAVDNAVDVPKATPVGTGSELEELVKNIRENQKAYKGEKKLKKLEFSRRQAEKRRLYDQYRKEGMSGQEAKRMADKALGGEYTKSYASQPNVSEETVNAILDKTKGDQNTQNAFARWLDPNRPEALRDWERSRIRRFIQSELGEEAAQSLDEAIVAAEQAGDRSTAGKVADFMTSAIAAGDISAVGRQGLSGIINHPKMSKAAWDDAARTIFSPEKYDEFVANLVNDADTAFIQENMGGRYLTLSDVADEARGQETTSKAISWYVDPSNRHYNTYLDSLRHQQKKAIIERYGGQDGFLKAAKAANPEDPDKWMKAWNNVIDRQSGRGSFGNTGSPTVGDMQVLFSARNLASKFQRLTAPLQFGLLKTNPSAYLYQLRETGTQAATLAATLAAINASGVAEIEDGKIKIGNTRIDITGGFSTIYKSMKNIYKAFAEEPDGSFDRTPWDITKDFLQNQLAPTIGMVTKFADVRRGGDGFFGFEDKYGNPINTAWLAQAAPIPAVAQNVVDGVVESENPLEIARNMLLDGLGFNTNTYQSADDKDKAARAEDANDVNPQLDSIKSSGLLTEDMIAAIDDEDVRDILTGKSDKQLSEDELGKVKSKLVEGISTEIGPDSDSAYRERGEYGLDRAALELKKQVLEAGPNPKPSDIKNLNIQIKRSKLLEEKDIPYEDLQLYKSVGVDEWRKMGIPPGAKGYDEDLYDPEMYQKLWAMDEMFTKVGGSYASGHPEKQKYSVKKSKSGSGGGRGGKPKFSTEFGKLGGSGSNAPRVREYQTMPQANGTIPTIRRVQPNIVHTIKAGRL